MNVLKQIVTKVSLVAVLVVIGLADSPANADSATKKCTYGANNSVSCTTSGSSSTRSRTSSSRSSRNTSNVNVNVSKKDVENLLFRSIFGSSNKPSQKH